MKVRGSNASCAFCIFVFATLGFAAQALSASNSVSIPAADHDDWRGEFTDFVLGDGSVLSEYSASTLSANQLGAKLVVSFVPRFECKPIISIQAMKSDVAADADTPIEFSIDDQTIEFSILDDEDGEFFLFTYHADSAQSRTLRNRMDVGSRASAVFGSASAALATSDAAESQSDRRVNFSLLGSRKAVLAVEQACKDHMPVPYP